VLLWFVMLSGITSTAPLSLTFFLRADTSNISGARVITQWTYLRVCGLYNTDCGPAWPDPAFGWAWASHPANAPAELVGDLGDGTTSYHYYYMWRFAWVFYLLALFFSTLGLFTGFLACCGRIGAAMATFTALTALFFETLGVSMMT
jgi:hypothetical protein